MKSEIVLENVKPAKNKEEFVYPYLDKFLEKHPDQHREIFEAIINSKELFMLLAPDLHHLQMFVNTFPNYKDNIFNAVLTHGIFGNYCHGHNLELVKLKTLFWDHSSDLRDLNGSSSNANLRF